MYLRHAMQRVTVTRKILTKKIKRNMKKIALRKYCKEEKISYRYLRKDLANAGIKPTVNVMYKALMATVK